MMGSGNTKKNVGDSFNNVDNCKSLVHTTPTTTTINMSNFLDTLTHPNSLSTLNYNDILKLPILSKKCYETMTENEISSTMWYNICKSFAVEFGLFLPSNSATGRIKFTSWRRVFADDLWPVRRKWFAENHQNETLQQSFQFKIKVSVRFRPAEKVDNVEKLNLPLHQLLRLKRKNGKKGGKGGKFHIAFGGKKTVPTHLLDAMTSRLMKCPRRLPSSGKVMELSVILKCIQRHPFDPFDGTPLNDEKELLRCPTLEKDILHYHSEAKEAHETKNHVSIDAIRKLAESGQALSPEVLEMLMEAETLMEQTNNASMSSDNPHSLSFGTDLSLSTINHMNNLNHNNTIATINGDNGDNNDNSGNSENSGNISGNSENSDVFLNGEKNHNNNFNNLNKDSSTIPPWKRDFKKRNAEKPRLLSVQNSRVNFFVPGSGVRQFLFPHCFDGNSAQSEVYSEVARSAVFAALNGMSSAILSYGQTGSGKTYTQFGPEGWEHQLTNEMNKSTFSNEETLLSSCGCVIRGVVDVLDCIQKSQNQNQNKIQCSATYTQIYQNACTDLMTNKSCTIRRDNGAIAGCSQYSIRTMKDALHVLQVGEKNKQFAATAMNQRSSRAHTIFTLMLSQSNSNGALIQSKLYFVDLAGSERIAKSKVRGKSLDQAIGINQSLHVLGKVIKQLITGKSHVPYLESKLTTLLRGCFGGDCLTRVLVSCRSDHEHSEESLNSLRFGERCSRITNTVEHSCTSMDSALSKIDASIQQCERGLQTLSSRGKDTAALQERKDLLVLKRKDLARLSSGVSITTV
jgi:hypothetical protein